LWRVAEEKTQTVSIVVVMRNGEEVTVASEPGLSVMQSIRDAGVEDMLALCGGVRSCATCHVFVDAEWVAAVGTPDPDETDLLDTSTHRQANSRLSCQIVVRAELDGLRVTMAPED
jgi:ferredoxin, 2Fe-2S